MRRRIFTILFFALAIWSSMLAGIKANGSCGENGDHVTWTLTDDGTLVIEGTGNMADYNGNNIPWISYRKNITNCVIKNGVTYIGSNALSSCSYLTSIDIPNSVTRIGSFAFIRCI